MPKPLTLVLRRLNRVRKIVHKGDVHYCERTEDGTIIDNDVASLRHINPITLERWLPGHQGVGSGRAVRSLGHGTPSWEGCQEE